MKIFITFFFVLGLSTGHAQSDTLRIDSIPTFGEGVNNLLFNFNQFSNYFSKDAYYFVNSRSFPNEVLMEGSISNKRPIGLWLYNDDFSKEQFIIHFEQSYSSDAVINFKVTRIDSTGKKQSELLQNGSFEQETTYSDSTITVQQKIYKKDELSFEFNQTTCGNVVLQKYYNDTYNSYSEWFNGNKLYCSEYFKNGMKDSVWTNSLSEEGFTLKYFYNNDKLVKIQMNDSFFNVPSTGLLELNVKIDSFLVKASIAEFQLTNTLTISTNTKKKKYIEIRYVNGNAANTTFEGLNWN